jgi:hypothetical protein
MCTEIKISCVFNLFLISFLFFFCLAKYRFKFCFKLFEFVGGQNDQYPRWLLILTQKIPKNRLNYFKKIYSRKNKPLFIAKQNIKVLNKKLASI